MLEKLPIIRAIVKIADNENNIVAGIAFFAAGVFALLDGISAASRATMMISLASVGFVVLAGFKPLDIAAYFANRYSHQAAMLTAEGLNVLEKLAKIDIDDRVETAITLEIEKKLANLPSNAELVEQFSILQAQIQAVLGIGPTTQAAVNQTLSKFSGYDPYVASTPTERMEDYRYSPKGATASFPASAEAPTPPESAA